MPHVPKLAAIEQIEVSYLINCIFCWIFWAWKPSVWPVPSPNFSNRPLRHSLTVGGAERCRRPKGCGKNFWFRPPRAICVAKVTSNGCRPNTRAAGRVPRSTSRYLDAEHEAAELQIAARGAADQHTSMSKFAAETPVTAEAGAKPKSAACAAAVARSEPPKLASVAVRKFAGVSQVRCECSGPGHRQPMRRGPPHATSPVRPCRVPSDAASPGGLWIT